MNFVFLSPHFPPNYINFSLHLHYLGVNVLGIADEPYENLEPRLKSVLTEYYRVNDMHSYEQLLRACGHFTHQHGKLDRLDSLNEYWLETEAHLRTDFNIPGIKNDEILRIKRKSLMKQVYQKAGILVAAGVLASTPAEARRFIQEVGYPIVAKPDIGVGAARTFKIHNESELDLFFSIKPGVDYILEEFVQGTIITFDGLTDRKGNPVFYTSHQYSEGIMEVVNNDQDVFYYSLREIPEDLEYAGRHVLNAFGVKERFFHFEFFRRHSDQKIVALEVNIRPPGGLTTDMFNYANDIDIYKEWAHIIVHDRFTADYSRPYHCCYVGRKNNRNYVHSHEQIQAELSGALSHHQPISGVFSAALGDYGYLVRSPSLEEIFDMVSFIQEKY